MVLGIFKVIATSGFLTKCTKFVFSRVSAPYPKWGSLQRSPRPCSWFKGPYTSKAVEQRTERKKNERIWDGRDRPPPFANS